MYFKSKKDTVYFCVIWGTVMISIVCAIMPIIYATSMIHFLWALPGILITGFLLWIWYRTGYHVENDTMTIEHGPLKDTIEIQKINEIEKRKNAWAAASLAMDRLVLKYGRFNVRVIVSPEQEYEFIKLLFSKNPEIQIDEKLNEMYTLGVKDRGEEVDSWTS